VSYPEVTLWDFAGVDGLELACTVFGLAACKLSVYQSLETEHSGLDCSLLRLSENNFRLCIHGTSQSPAEALNAAAAGKQVWLKQSVLNRLKLGEEALETLQRISTVKPPHRLMGLPNARAVPVRIEGIAALVWHHNGIFEVQTARNCADNSISPLPLTALLAFAEPR
jgi:hypothetical protein